MNIFNWLFYAGYDRKVFENDIKDSLLQHNKSRLSVFSTFFVLGCLVMAISSMLVPALAGMRSIYLAFLAVSSVIFVLSRFFCDKNESLVIPLAYALIISVLAFGMLIGTVASPAEISATYIALLLIVPQLFIDKTYRMHAVVMCINIVFILMVLRFKDQVTWTSDITNALIFYALSVLMGAFNVNNSVSRYLMEKKIREMAVIDPLTGLLNRNSYEIAISQAESAGADSLYCVYVDANGLHELNNTKGHEAGDRMLTFTGKSMQSIFGRDVTYRIGGDEFVAVGSGLSEPEIRDCIERLKMMVAGEGYHVAAGYCIDQTRGSGIKESIKAAEAMMYSDKQAYYDAEGKDPRRIH